MNEQQWRSFWQGMRDNDFIMVDASKRKIAIFSNEGGQVVIATQDGSQQCITTICGDEIEDLERLLAAAKREANEINARLHAEFTIWRAKQSATEKGRG